MEKTWNFILVFALLVVAGIIFGRLFLHEQQGTEPVPEETAETLVLFTPEERTPETAVNLNEEPTVPVDLPAIDITHVMISPPVVPLPLELAELFDKPVDDVLVSEPVVIPQPAIITQSHTELAEDTVATAELEKQPAPESVPSVQKTPVSPAPGSYIYFFTGVPAQSALIPAVPVPQFAYTSGFVSVSFTSAPVVPSFTVPVPVFVPQVISGRIGAPKWGYSNGVVIRPTVYFYLR